MFTTVLFTIAKILKQLITPMKPRVVGEQIEMKYSEVFQITLVQCNKAYKKWTSGTIR